MNLEKEKAYILSSAKRTKLIMLLDTVGATYGAKIGELLFMPTSMVTMVTKQLEEHNLIEHVDHSRYKIFVLTNDGKKVVKELEKDYDSI